MMPKKKNTSSYFLFILIATFIVIVSWIGTNIYSKFVSSTIDETLTIQTKPINPSFDARTINALKSRRSVTPLNRLEGGANATPTPSVSPTVSPEEPADTISITPLPLPETIVTLTPSPTQEAGGAI